jgi:hypothetical protein
MTKKLLILCLFCASIVQAQLALPYSQDFESETLGANPATDLAPIYTEVISAGVGSSIIAVGTGTNSTQVLHAETSSFSSNGKNHYLDSPAFTCTPGTSYTIQFDLYATSSSTNIKVLTSSDGTSFDNLVYIDPNLLNGTSTVGAFGLKHNKKGVLKANEITDHASSWTTVSMSFEAPASQIAFRFQFYKFDVNTLELDNISVAQSGAASIDKISINNVQLASNLVGNLLTVDSSISINTVTLIDLTGKTSILSEVDKHSFDTSSIKSGLYLANITLENGLSKTFKIIKK